MKKSLLLILTIAFGFAVNAQTPGTPVETFGEDGYSIFAINPTFDELNNVVVTPDGYVYTLGQTTMSDWTAFVSRLDPNGIMDQTFATNGTFTYNIPGYAGYGRGGHYYEDGSFIFGIHAFDIQYYSDCDSHLVKLTPDGSLDPTFGTNGHVRYEDGTAKTTLIDTKVLPDGRIVMIGCQNDRLIVICFNANGTLDTTFGTNGFIKPNFTTTLSGVYPNGSCIQADGKIVVCGMADCENNSYRGFVVRINPNGTLDNTFGTSEPGLSQIDLHNDGHYEIFMEPGVQSNGKVVICGHLWKGQSGGLDCDVFVARINDDGSLDSTFGTDGFVEAEFEEHVENNAVAMVVSATDDISVAGDLGGFGAMFVVNVTAEGEINDKYGDTGIFEFLNNGRQNKVKDIALSHGNYGDIIVGGYTAHADNNGTDIAVGKFYSAAIPTIPVIEASVQSLGGFYYTEGEGPSESNTYQISGYNIVNDITVSATEDFEISLDNQTFSSELTFGPTELPKTIYVRLKAGLEEETYEGEILNSCEGAESVTVYLYGMVDEPEGIMEIEDMNINIRTSNNNIVVENNSVYNVNVSVYNIAGQIVFSTTIGQGAQQLDRSFNAGAYIVKMSANDSESVKKVIVR